MSDDLSYELFTVYDEIVKIESPFFNISSDQTISQTRNCDPLHPPTSFCCVLHSVQTVSTKTYMFLQNRCIHIHDMCMLLQRSTQRKCFVAAAHVCRASAATRDNRARPCSTATHPVRAGERQGPVPTALQWRVSTRRVHMHRLQHHRQRTTQDDSSVDQGTGWCSG